MLINRLAIMGTGLIGGSLALSLRRANACSTIIGYDRNEQQLKIALEHGVIDCYELEAAKTAAQADVIVIAVPIQATATLLEEINGSLGSDTIITDVGSVKGDVVSTARRILATKIDRFIPGHPIAGTEKSGVTAAISDLFDRHKVILTPLPETNHAALSLIRQMWEASGADVSFLGVQNHDAILAATSHLPHLLAYALVDCLTHMQDKDKILQYAAGGFADFTRIASSNPRMWHDICLANQSQLLDILERFSVHIDAIRHAIECGDGTTLLRIFSDANATRAQFTELYQPSTAPQSKDHVASSPKDKSCLTTAQ